MKLRGNCISLLAIFTIFSSVLLGGPVEAMAGKSEKLYTAYNVWRLRGLNMRFINYKYGNRFIPAGTEVSDVSVDHADNFDGISDELPSVTFTTVQDRKRYTIYFYDRYHPGKNIDDYVGLTFVSGPVEELTKGFSEDEMTAIEQGVIGDGMSKQAVLVCYGPPPEHRTRSLDDTRWLYWKSKREIIKVNFDSHGLTMDAGFAAGIKSNPKRRAGSSGGTGASEIHERLKTLQVMKQQGLISEEEYQGKKQELLGRL